MKLQKFAGDPRTESQHIEHNRLDTEIKKVLQKRALVHGQMDTGIQARPINPVKNQPTGKHWGRTVGDQANTGLINVTPMPDAGPSFKDKFNDALASIEKSGTDILGIKDVIEFASSAPKALGYDQDNRGPADAMRHLLLSAELYRTHPYLAPVVLKGHEYFTNVLQGQPAEDREQDLFNNEIGKRIGQQAKSREEVQQMAMAALKQARILPQQGQIR